VKNFLFESDFFCFLGFMFSFGFLRLTFYFCAKEKVTKRKHGAAVVRRLG